MTSADHLDAVAPVPPGTAVLHIGPHKTGTSALQTAMWQARGALREQGVLVAGPGGPDDGDGVRYALDGTPIGGEEVGRRAWERIRSDLADASVPRRVFSRETFANAPGRRARWVVRDLRQAGVERAHIVISARPLAELIPSQYSQFVQRGSVSAPFEEWVSAVLSGASEEHSVKLFWKRHSHDEQVRRWSAVVGAENVTVVVVDRKDPLFLPHAFERLLDVRPGTLAEQMGHDRGNRSLTLAELELVRQWHVITDEAGAEHGKKVRLAWQLAHHLRRFNPDPTDPRLALPGWAVAQANERAAAAADAIAAAGVQVVGDLGSLAAVPLPR